MKNYYNKHDLVERVVNLELEDLGLGITPFNF